MMAKVREIMCKKEAKLSVSALFCLFVLTAVCFSNVQAAVRYVDAGVPVSGGGTSWAQAYKTIQEAVNDPACDEIWVKAGDYLLLSGITANKAVGIYGGFNGTETQWHQRDWATNVTIVDGQNAVRCFNVAGGNDFVLDGFTIQNGRATTGGGLYNNATPVTISNCIFQQNIVTQNGGGIYNQNASSLITNCLFLKNEGNYYGGGIYNIQSSCTVINCVFFRNEVTQYGGGIYNQTNSSATVINSILWDDIASSNGEIGNAPGSSATVTYCNIDQFGYGGTNISVDPQFVDFSDPDPSLWDLRLQLGSPCIDAGTDVVPNPPGLPLVDLDGRLRIWDGDGDTVEVVDMGAYEYGSPAFGPDISVSPSALDFGKIVVGSVSSQKTITILNTGFSDLIIDEIKVSDLTNYNIVASDPITLGSGQDTFVFVRFAPKLVGQIDATISVKSDDPDEPIVVIPLTGIAEDDTNKSGSGTTPTAPGGLTTSGGGGGGGGCFIGTAEHSSSGLTGWFLIVGAITLWFTCSVVRKRTN